MVEQQNNPKLVFKDLKYFGTPVQVKLDCAVPAKTGTTAFGEWHMWFGFVENQQVTEGRKPNEKKVAGYTGKVIFFPSKKLNERLTEVANGKVGAVVTIQKQAEEGSKGAITKYVVEKIKDGEPTRTDLTPTEIQLVNDMQAVVDGNVKISEEDFVKVSQEDQYEGKIAIARARDLYKFLK